jgi:hypothetical protein
MERLVRVQGELFGELMLNKHAQQIRSLNEVSKIETSCHLQSYLRKNFLKSVMSQESIRSLSGGRQVTVRSPLLIINRS